MEYDRFGLINQNMHYEKKHQTSNMYVEREKHWMARKVKEAILINAVNPTKKIEADGALNLEKGYEVDSIWSGFNEDFRAMLEEKFK